MAIEGSEPPYDAIAEMYVGEVVCSSSSKPKLTFPFDSGSKTGPVGPFFGDPIASSINSSFDFSVFSVE